MENQMAMIAERPNNIIETELYRCVIDEAESTVTITTDLGAEFARRFAEFEAQRLFVSISLVFHDAESENSRAYVFRLRHLNCMPDSPDEEDSKRYEGLERGRDQGGCPHSKKGSRDKCSLCIAAKEKSELIAMIKAGKL